MSSWFASEDDQLTDACPLPPDEFITISAKPAELKLSSTDKLSTCINVFFEFFTVTYSPSGDIYKLAKYLKYDLHLHSNVTILKQIFKQHGIVHKY